MGTNTHMPKGNYNFGNTRVKQHRLLESSSSSIPVNIANSHIESDEEIIFESNMGDTYDTRDLITALLRSQQDMQNNVNRMANLMA